MKNQSLFRYAGIAAIISAVLYVASLVASIAGASAVGTPLYWLSSILLVAALVVLYVDLRAEAATPALAAFILLAGMTIWSLFLDPVTVSPIFIPLAMAYGIGFFLLGWLQRRSDRYPNGLGNLALATGALSVLGGILLLGGAGADAFGLINLVLSVPFVIWCVWLGLLYLKGQTATVPQAA
ncbi:MAG: hypothetical protein KatS3mg050_5034 [Litorilinea sp.]|nr:MAG: hypothetical protein KatS3mg050_5034 [Litorilinea sp.]